MLGAALERLERRLRLLPQRLAAAQDALADRASVSAELASASLGATVRPERLRRPPRRSRSRRSLERGEVLLLVGARAVRAARRAAPRGRREAEAPPRAGGPGRGRRALAAAAARRGRSARGRRAPRPAAPAGAGPGAPLALRRQRDLERLLPPSLGEPVAGSVADPDDEGGLAPDLVAVWVLGGDPVRPQDGVRRSAARRRSPPRPPRGRVATRSSSRPAASRSERSAGITVRRVRGTSGGGPGSARRARRRRRGGRPRARAQRLHDDDGLPSSPRRRAPGSARRRAPGVRGRRAARSESAGGRGRSRRPQPIAGACG